MKSTFAVAAVAAIVGGVSATNVHHRHAHDLFHGLDKKDYANATCEPGCTTIYSTYYGEATLHIPSPTSSSAPASSSVPASSSSSVPASSSAAPTSKTVVVVVPTPIAQTCSTTGVYTFPATTVTLTETATACAPSSTAVTSGTHTLGGVTTVVSTATTVVCPYATVSTSEGTVTSVIKTTTYVCPSAGTYTIGPVTTTVSKPTTVVVPTITTYLPGTYTQPELTTTVTETNTVVYCPYTSSSAAPVFTTSAAATSAVATSAVPTYAVGTSSSSPPKSTGGLTTGNGKAPWAITYTPYTATGDCKAAADVASDIADIAKAGITAVRVYSTDCSTLPNVGSACAANGLKMILGIYIDAAHCTATAPTIAEQISAIKSWAQWDLVEMLVVGNEAIFNQYCTAGELVDLINECKSEFSGFTGPYTTSDTVSVWQQSDVNSVLCDAVDIVGCQAHAFFNADTDASQAGAFVKGQLDIVNNICPGKAARVLETGWPSAGNCLGKACPGEAEQAQAIASLLSTVGTDAVFFSLGDDEWKSDSTACACEQHWGCKSALGF